MACYKNESFQRFELIAHLHGWVATIIDAFVDFENYLDVDIVSMEMEMKMTTMLTKLS